MCVCVCVCVCVCSIEVAMSGMTDLRSTQSQVQILDLDETCSPRADLDASFAKLRQLHMPSKSSSLDILIVFTG